MTSQPDLEQAVLKADPASANRRKSNSSRRSSKKAASPTSGSGNNFSRFSARFPWRRLKMSPEDGIVVRIAGRKVWPVPEAVSPLQILVNQGSAQP